jgi:hypothetical protein
VTELTAAVRDVERHVAESGWDQPARLYALVETADLLRTEPQLAEQLGVGLDLPDHGGLTAIEQEELPEYASLEELLSGIAWPPQVLGAALVVERLVLPEQVESRLPPEEQEALDVISEHPDRRELRLAAGVLRDGRRECVARLRGHEDDEDVLTGPDIAPGLTDALAATLQE